MYRDAEYEKAADAAMARARQECEKYAGQPDKKRGQFIRRYARYTQKAYLAWLQRTGGPRVRQ